jgi:OPT family oligopeptide transporter
VRTLTTRAALGEGDNTDPELIPNSWWIGGILLASPVLMLIADHYFNIPWYLTAIAIPMSAVLASVGVRSTGETNVNPVGGLGKVTQLVFGGLAPGQISTNLMAAAITAGGASQAADMMQDLKTGYLLGASPRKLFIAQLGGVVAGVVFIVPVFQVLTNAYGLGSEKLPAPAAFAWKAMAEVLVDGFDSLPPNATTAAAIAAAFGIALPLMRRITSIRAFVPSGLAFGIGFITLPEHALSMFYGLLIVTVWKLFKASSAEQLSFAVASGFIAGEGLMGIVNAILTLSGIGPK